MHKKATINGVKHQWRKIAYRLGKRTLYVLLVLFVILGAVRLSLPYVVKSYVNKKLNQIPDYRGHVASINIHLLRGAYTIHHLKIEKMSNRVRVPFFYSPKVDLSMQWKELFHGSFVGEIYVDQGSLNFVQGPSEDESQTKIDKSWIGIVEDLFPCEINRFEVKRSEVRFQNFHSSPQVNVYITNVFMVATNLKNTRDSKEQLPAALEMHGITAGNGRLDFVMHMDPMARTPAFYLTASLEGMNLVALNNMLEAYALINVHGGRFRMYAEMAAADGKFEGYVKPFFEDLDIIELKKDIKNPIELFWKTIIAGVSQIFKNQPKDRIATKIPLSGNIENPDIGFVGTILNLLKNAFVKALSPKIDMTIDPEKVGEKKPGTESNPP